MTETQTRPDPGRSLAGEAEWPLPAHNWGWFLFRGVLALVLGILAILFPFSAITAFAFLFALFAFVDGVGLVVSGIAGAANHRARWWGLVLAGLMGIAVGVIYVLWPQLATFSYALVLLIMISAWAVVNGIAQISAAVRLREEIEGEWLLGLAGFFSLLLGIAILVAAATVPGASILSVAWIIGFWALLFAATLIALAFRLKEAKGRVAQ